MNVSQAVSSTIAGVDFGFLTAEEIKSYSVKRIVNPTTFDSLLNPVPGGLYDHALGSLGSTSCSTCGLGQFDCSGHCGHVELPVRVYHLLFLDQAYRLLRAKCVYCHRLRIPRVITHQYKCKFQLVRHGLIEDARAVDGIRSGLKNRSKEDGSSSQSEEEGDDYVGAIMNERNAHVRRCILRATEKIPKRQRSVEKTEAIAWARKELLRGFFSDLLKAQKCSHCKGISASYRKEKSVKVFKKPLKSKQKAAMAASEFKAIHPSILLKRRREKVNGMHPDEGVADLESNSTSDEDTSMGEDETEIEGEQGGLIAQTSAASKSTSKSKLADKEVFMTATEVHDSLQLLFEEEAEILGLIYSPQSRAKGRSPPNADMFFIKTLLVPPSKFRPDSKTGDNEVTEAATNTLYKNILTACEDFNRINADLNKKNKEEQPKNRSYNDLLSAWVQLQERVNSLIDQNHNPIQGAAGKNNPEGVKQILEKKEGLFRMNLMGKRVNFAARSVISPDPNIETNEIGVPPVFAMKLTYPEPVTNHNFYDLKEAVVNGPTVWPGAVAIENENGQVINLGHKNQEERNALANQLLAPSNINISGTRNKKVHRHLNNGDVVIMNRQPTLHKPSMMAHRARVLPGEKTIRMHYANCNTYNADFDGDEMNMHFPQNELARAEAMLIVDTDHQYLSGTAGAPLRGLIQDHISIAVLLTTRDTFFSREEYQQLLYASLRPEDNHTTTGNIETEIPAIMRPKPMWTGKQVVSTILNNIKPLFHPGLSLLPKTQKNISSEEDQEMMFFAGAFVSGMLDKKQIGPKPGGLVNAVYETYGHTVAGRFLSVLGRLLTKLLHMKAFSCGIEDIILTPDGDRIRHEKLKGADDIGLSTASKYVSLDAVHTSNDDSELMKRLEEVLRDTSKQSGLDILMNAQTGPLSAAISGACMPGCLVKQFPKNQMQRMTVSGAKGTNVNANLISCNLGQQILEGRRVPVMVSGKSLPCFKPFEANVRAGGFVTDRFLTGIRPQEYYFHTMAGREGLIDTAVKTASSGYLQRCLIKNMEGLKVEHDTSVRNFDGSMIQYLYGEDGLEVSKSTYLFDFKFQASNFFSMVQSLNLKEDYPKIQDESITEEMKTSYKIFKRDRDLGSSEVLISRYPPAQKCGSVSERFYTALKKYVDDNPDKLLKSKNKDSNKSGVTSKRNFQTALTMKYMRSVVESGEPVGVVAGQSIGEPSTQMTLNTFHLAGHSAKNVTLGIPRLREILMTASTNISTPSMTLHLIPEVSKVEGETFAKTISRLPLSAVVDNATVSEKLGRGVSFNFAKTYDIELKFFSEQSCETEYAVDTQRIKEAVMKTFVPILQSLIRKELKKKGQSKSKRGKIVIDALPEIGVSAGPSEQQRGPNNARAQDEGEDSDDEGDDGDATTAKTKANRTMNVSYDDPGGEEEEMMKSLESGGSGESDDSEVEEDGEGEGADDEAASHRKSHRSSRKEEEKDFVKSSNKDVSTFEFDDENRLCRISFEYSGGTSKMLILSMVEKACNDSTIQSVPGIRSSTYANEEFFDKQNNTKANIPVVITEGCNLMAVRRFQNVINPNKIFTNDIDAMRRCYGVEACRSNIVREMASVFSSHTIDVDYRHLSLVADFMTRNGGFDAFNRMGMRNACSPFMKMSYETSFEFLRDAVLSEDRDDLKNPSARIVLGKFNKVGTGGFDILTPVA